MSGIGIAVGERGGNPAESGPRRSKTKAAPSWAALASWVELLNSQAGGGHYYEDVTVFLNESSRRTIT